MKPINFILIEDSNWCNMRCDYCDYWKNNQDAPHQLLSIENLNKIYSFAEQLNNPCEILHLYTEPLLNWNNIKEATELHSLNNITHNIYSNGLLLNDEKVNWLLSHNFNITLSYDGLDQNIRSNNTNSILLNLINQFPYCFSISATMHKLGLQHNLDNVKFLSHLPVQGIAYKPNTIYNWSLEELYNYYKIIYENCSFQELQLLSLNKEALDTINTWSPQAQRQNALVVKSNGDVYQHIQIWDLIYIGNCDNFINNIKDYAEINYYSEIYNCNDCELKKNCQYFDNPDYFTKIGQGNCDYRKALYRCIKGE